MEWQNREPSPRLISGAVLTIRICSYEMCAGMAIIGGLEIYGQIVLFLISLYLKT
jgi:hypothetical protein